ncbi:MAG: glycosyltransferase [Nitrospirales bacterium]|nr:glycosyltransferase [Nitrospirales bacterium]
MRPLKKLLILLPVHEDRDCLRRLLCDIAALKLPATKLLIIDDGSVYAPPDEVDIIDAGLAGKIIRLRHNAGHQMAIAVGLMYAAQHYVDRAVLVMDADGEDPSDAIPELIRRYESNTVDVVAATRARRHENRSFRLCYRLYMLLFTLLTGRSMSFGNFMLLSANAVKWLSNTPSLAVHFPATVLASGLVFSLIPVNRGRRYTGASRMSFASLVGHGIRSMKIFAGAVFVRLASCVSAIAIVWLALGTLATVLERGGVVVPRWVYSAGEVFFVGSLCSATVAIATMVLMCFIGFGSPKAMLLARKSAGVL